MKMKKVLSSLFAFVLVVLMSSFATVDAATETYLNLYSDVYPKTQKVFSYEAGSQTIYAVPDSTTYSWTASVNVSWLSLSKTTGAASNPYLVISFPENKTRVQRTGVVTITAGSMKETFTIIQSGNSSVVDTPVVPSIFVQGTNYTASANGQNFFVGASATEDWYAMSDCSFIYFVDPKSNHNTAGGSTTMYIGVKANNTGSARTGHVTVKAGSMSKTITFTQPAR